MGFFSSIKLLLDLKKFLAENIYFDCRLVLNVTVGLEYRTLLPSPFVRDEF